MNLSATSHHSLSRGNSSDRISLTSLREAGSASPLVSMCIRSMSARTFCRALATCCPRVFFGGLPISRNPEHHEGQEGHDHRQDEVESSPCQGILTNPRTCAYPCG